MNRLLTLLGLAIVPILFGAETLEHDGALYQVYRVPLAEQSRLHLRWLDDGGKPLSNFGGLQQQLDKEGKKIAFATNAGIYERGPKPCGLTICDGKDGPGIAEAEEFRGLGVKPRLANQSGPLILRKGVIHPAFKVNSPNKRQRSAIGVVKGTQEILFVMSDREDRVKGRVTFHQLARLFLHLGCEDALFLDGDISQMITSPAAGTKFTPNTFAGMFVVTE
jgi:uncharacterized protein YigE (DUF2233 family)